MPSTRIRLAAGSIVVAFAVAACSSSATPAPSDTSAAAGASASSEASAPASEAPAASASDNGGGGGAAASSGGALSDKALEASLPSSFGGQATTKVSMSDIPGAAGLGLSGNMGVASATTADGKVTFFAVSMAGATTQLLQQIFLMSANASNGELQSVNVGGRSGFKTTSSSGKITYFYINNNAAYGAEGPDDATAQQAFAALP